ASALKSWLRNRRDLSPSHTPILAAARANVLVSPGRQNGPLQRHDNIGKSFIWKNLTHVHAGLSQERVLRPFLKSIGGGERRVRSAEAEGCRNFDKVLFHHEQ
ncbi:MAG: hypothetical protein ACI8QF_003054, partial [Limisphaerales bacterium]